MLLRPIKHVDRPSFHAAVVAGSKNSLSVSEGKHEGVRMRIAYLERRAIREERCGEQFFAVLNSEDVLLVDVLVHIFTIYFGMSTSSKESCII